ncbi:hypothetical protein RvY_12101 [Ramazzottius varieornatus]|uniref:Uncharacterized protein n=1 Tax=Ramazzottius varieornatus TaxID=947166 RepID=A0A1D1VNS1_RAMVA|nr:hypothetical protein RvY_12101 [Ramazzottius varieornatus]
MHHDRFYRDDLMDGFDCSFDHELSELPGKLGVVDHGVPGMSETRLFYKWRISRMPVTERPFRDLIEVITKTSREKRTLNYRSSGTGLSPGPFKRTPRIVGEVFGKRVYRSVNRYDITHKRRFCWFRSVFSHGLGTILSHSIGSLKYALVFASGHNQVSQRSGCTNADECHQFCHVGRFRLTSRVHPVSLIHDANVLLRFFSFKLSMRSS